FFMSLRSFAFDTNSFIVDKIDTGIDRMWIPESRRADMVLCGALWKLFVTVVFRERFVYVVFCGHSTSFRSTSFCGTSFREHSVDVVLREH
ncbi:5887_t:CDS:1, partial [Gigaspora rosea]